MNAGYHRPASIEEAVEILASVPDAVPITGGTDLMVRMRPGLPDAVANRPDTLVSLRHIPELTAIDSESSAGGEGIRIGAAVPVGDVADHPWVRAHLPALVQAIEVFGSPQIRNVASLGGNLGNASPAADSAPPLIVYGARVEVSGPGSRRYIPVVDLLTGPGRTALEPGEIITAVVIGPQPRGQTSMYMRKGRVRMDVALVGVATALVTTGSTCTDIALAAGAVGPTPMRLHRTEELLRGSSLDPPTVARAAALAATEVSPIDDIRASADYRRRLVEVFVRRSLGRLGSARTDDAGRTES